MKHACSRAGGTNAGSSKGPGVHRACPRTRLLGAAAPRGGGPVGGQGLMLRVDFREALTVVWCFNVLGPENQAFWLWGGRK